MRRKLRKAFKNWLKSYLKIAEMEAHMRACGGWM